MCRRAHWPRSGSVRFASQEYLDAAIHNILTQACVAIFASQLDYIFEKCCSVWRPTPRFHSISFGFIHWISTHFIVNSTPHFPMVSSIDLKALNVFVQSAVTQDMIHKLVVKTLQVIPCLEDKNKKSTTDGKPLPSLMTFINRLVRYTNVYTGTLMATLVYLERLKQKLPKNAQGLPCTRHRIFLSCLILASKFHNDSSPKNIHWAKYTDGLFSNTDVNLMERQLLYLLNWDIRVTNEQMVGQLGKFLEPIKEDLVRTSKMRNYLQKQQQAVAAQLQAERDMLSTPSISRSSSTSSALSLGYSHSRSSSMASSHNRQDSSSSIESMSPVMTKSWANGIDPRIEMAAQTEEIELTRMLNKLCKTSY